MTGDENDPVQNEDKAYKRGYADAARAAGYRYCEVEKQAFIDHLRRIGVVEDFDNGVRAWIDWPATAKNIVERCAKIAEGYPVAPGAAAQIRYEFGLAEWPK